VKPGISALKEEFTQLAMANYRNMSAEVVAIARRKPEQRTDQSERTNQLYEQASISLLSVA
jgi:hypothetical protein